jgi:hypothetical protein
LRGLGILAGEPGVVEFTVHPLAVEHGHVP